MVGGEVAVGYDDEGRQIVIGSPEDVSRGRLPPAPHGTTYYTSESAYRPGRSYKKSGRRPKIQITPPKITPLLPITQKKIGGEVAVGYDAEGKRVVIGKISDIRRGRLPPPTYEAMRTELEATQLRRRQAQIERETARNIIERARERFSAEKLRKDIEAHGKALGLFKHYVLSPLAFPVEEAERLSEATFLYGYSDIFRPSVATPEEISQALQPTPFEKYTPIGASLGVIRRYVTLEDLRYKGEVALKQQETEADYLNKQITRSQLAEQKNFVNTILTEQYGESFTQWNKEQTAKLEALSQTQTEQGYEKYAGEYGKYAQEFQKRETKYGQIYGDYKKNIESADKQLRDSMKFADIEMKTKTEKGKEVIEFSSKNLALDLTPIGIKQYKAGGKYRYEMIASQVGGRTAEAFTLGLALGGTGTSKVISDMLKIQRWSRTAKVLVGLGIPTVATGVSAYGGYKAGQPYNLQKEMAMVYGGATLSSFAGFVAGDILGSQIYLAGQQEKLEREAMQLTKQWSKRTGKIYALEGTEKKITLAKQKSVLETRLPSVKGKIKTYGELVSIRSGGKKITGFARGGAISYYNLEGKPIKTKDLIISKIEMLEGKNSKASYKVLSAQLNKNIKKGYLDTFYSKSQLMKKPKIISLAEGKKLYKFQFGTGTALAKSEIVGKPEFKKTLFTRAEILKFMKTGKAVTLKQWALAKPYEISVTKQYSLLYRPETIGKITAIKFEAVGKTKGMGTDLIKKLLREAMKEQLKLENQMRLKSYVRTMFYAKKGGLMMPKISPTQAKISPIKLSMPYQQANMINQQEALMNAHVKNTGLIIHQILSGGTRSVLESSVLAGLIMSPRFLLEQRKIMLTRAIQPTKLTLTAKGTLLQQIKVAQTQMTKMQLKQMQIQKIIEQTIIKPIQMPIIPQIPLIPPILFPLPTYEGGQAKKGYRFSISKRLLAYNPDITSRLLLIKAKKDQDKIINKFYSGLELRPLV